MGRTRTLVNAVIGAIVAVVLSFIPFSTVIGGAVAGFLQGPDGKAGAIAGALAGLLMIVPFVGIGLFIVFVVGVGVGVGSVPAFGFLFLLAVFGIVSSILLTYTVGLAFVGGYIGAYLARDYPDRHRNVRDAIDLDDGDTYPGVGDENARTDRESVEK